jgi:hypothetical protein
MTAIHLLVLVHGMWGNPEHLAELARIAEETHTTSNADGTNLHILLAETIKDDSTYDGVDWGGERIAKEVFPLWSLAAGRKFLIDASNRWSTLSKN